MSSLICYWYILCPTISFLCLFPFSMLLVRFYKVKYYKTFANTMLILLEEKKFWILIISILSNIVVFLWNAIHIPSELELVKENFSVIDILLNSIGPWLIIYYIFKKSSKGLERTSRIKWIKYVLKPIIWFSVICSIGWCLYLETEIIELNNKSD